MEKASLDVFPYFLRHLHAQALYGLAHVLGDGLNDEKMGVPVVFSQVIFSLLEVEAISLVAVHEYREGGLPAP